MITLSRRQFIQSLGAGLMIAVAAPAIAQQVPRAQRTRRGGGGFGGGPVKMSARIHIAPDGAITIMTGKVECGQGARAEITLAAAEELRVHPDDITLIMGDTTLCPDDGGTYGSQTTPRSIPSIRLGCAAARGALLTVAAEKMSAKAEDLHAADGKISDSNGHEAAYGTLVGDALAAAFSQQPSADVKVTAVSEWKTLGSPYLRSDRTDLVTGKHVYPSDVVRPGMLYGKVLRPPSYGATLKSIALTAAGPDVIVARDGDFVSVAAATSRAAQKSIESLAKTAVWDETKHISSKDLYAYLKQNARGGGPINPYADDLPKASAFVKQEYHVAYIQHAPLEPRTATAEWTDGKLTVWTGTQNPFGVRGELARAFDLPPDSVRVIVPDFGGGFGGKHIGDPAVEAARIAKAAGRPVHVRWTREEEFTWAYFRPAAVILVEAGLTPDGEISSWWHANINSGPQGTDTPYRAKQRQTGYIPSDPPLRHGSYRALASTANNFAREVFVDELALAAKKDPLQFRLTNLDDHRLSRVLKTAADEFGWSNNSDRKPANTGVGLAGGTEKGSFVAACAEVFVDPKTNTVSVTRVTQAFDCGPIHNPAGLLSQVQGAIVMGIGAALREEIQFENGRITNANFADYAPPRFADVPKIDVHLIDNREAPIAGAGETPIIAIAPAIANAVFNATGKRVRQMPVRLDA
jgi:isoquinoline 1-oxidoreductase